MNLTIWPRVLSLIFSIKVLKGNILVQRSQIQPTAMQRVGFFSQLKITSTFIPPLTQNKLLVKWKSANSPAKLVWADLRCKPCNNLNTTILYIYIHIAYDRCYISKHSFESQKYLVMEPYENLPLSPPRFFNLPCSQVG